MVGSLMVEVADTVLLVGDSKGHWVAVAETAKYNGKSVADIRWSVLKALYTTDFVLVRLVARLVKQL